MVLTAWSEYSRPTHEEQIAAAELEKQQLKSGQRLYERNGKVNHWSSDRAKDVSWLNTTTIVRNWHNIICGWIIWPHWSWSIPPVHCQILNGLRLSLIQARNPARCWYLLPSPRQCNKPALRLVVSACGNRYAPACNFIWPESDRLRPLQYQYLATGGIDQLQCVQIIQPQIILCPFLTIQIYRMALTGHWLCFHIIARCCD